MRPGSATCGPAHAPIPPRPTGYLATTVTRAPSMTPARTAPAAARRKTARQKATSAMTASAALTEPAASAPRPTARAATPTATVAPLAIAARTGNALQAPGSIATTRMTPATMACAARPMARASSGPRRTARRVATMGPVRTAPARKRYARNSAIPATRATTAAVRTLRPRARPWRRTATPAAGPRMNAVATPRATPAATTANVAVWLVAKAGSVAITRGASARSRRTAARTEYRPSAPVARVASLKANSVRRMPTAAQGPVQTVSAWAAFPCKWRAKTRLSAARRVVQHSVANPLTSIPRTAAGPGVGRAVRTLTAARAGRATTAAAARANISSAIQTPTAVVGWSAAAAFAAATSASSQANPVHQGHRPVAPVAPPAVTEPAAISSVMPASGLWSAVAASRTVLEQTAPPVVSRTLPTPSTMMRRVPAMTSAAVGTATNLDRCAAGPRAQAAARSER